MILLREYIHGAWFIIIRQGRITERDLETWMMIYGSRRRMPRCRYPIRLSKMGHVNKFDRRGGARMDVISLPVECVNATIVNCTFKNKLDE